MFVHVTVGTNDLKRSAAFYDALLAPLGLEQRVPNSASKRPVASWVSPNSKLPKFFVMAPHDRQPASVGNGAMVAFSASSAEVVDAAYTAGLKAGGTDEGGPGFRPEYGDGYYGAYLRDPDGNKVHVVFRGDLVG